MITAKRVKIKCLIMIELETKFKINLENNKILKSNFLWILPTNRLLENS